MPRRLRRRQNRSMLTALSAAMSVALLAALTLSLNPVAAEEAKPAHNLAEGDNPALDEKALQAENSETNPSEQNSQSSAKPGSTTSGGATANSNSAGAIANWSSLDSIVEKLIREYYPKAKIKPGTDKIYVEYKAKPCILPSTNKQEQGPDWGGVVIDMQLQKGPYAGVHQVPKKFNEYSYYSVELYAPYSQKYDCHLLTRICYPFDVPQEFLKRFKKVVEDFEQYL